MRIISLLLSEIDRGWNIALCRICFGYIVAFRYLFAGSATQPFFSFRNLNWLLYVPRTPKSPIDIPLFEALLLRYLPAMCIS
jgi:hypothetical protein